MKVAGGERLLQAHDKRALALVPRACTQHAMSAGAWCALSDVIALRQWSFVKAPSGTVALYTACNVVFPPGDYSSFEYAALRISGMI